MIEVRALRKTYGDLVAVDDVSFSVQAGETFGLLGPNGAGKSTTIGCIVGALHADSGEIRLANQPDPTRAEVRREIGLAPQRLSLYEELSGEENLAFFGRLYGLTGKRLSERIQWCLEVAQLTDRRKDAVGKYSGGMQRRLNLACALVHQPKILLLDEPTVGVDPQSRNHIFESIEAMQGEGLTVIFTTHYMEEAERLCNRIAIVDRGRILALDTLDGLVAAHGGDTVVRGEFARPPADPGAVPVPLDGAAFSHRTAQPGEIVAQLARVTTPLESLHVERPDLEAVFLNLTGRSLRD